MNEVMELARHSGHTRQGVLFSPSVEARPGLTWSPAQAVSSSRASAPPTVSTHLPQSPQDLSVAWPGVAQGLSTGVALLTAHLAQMREYCPAATHHGMEVQLFSSSPVTRDTSARLGLCSFVRYSEVQGQWSDVMPGQCFPEFPNMRPVLLVSVPPTAPGLVGGIQKAVCHFRAATA